MRRTCIGYVISCIALTGCGESSDDTDEDLPEALVNPHCPDRLGFGPVDGLLDALDAVSEAQQQVAGDFESALENTEEELDLAGEGDLTARADEVIRILSERISDNTSGLRVEPTAPVVCTSSKQAAGTAQIRCEQAACSGTPESESYLRLDYVCSGDCTSQGEGDTCEGECVGTLIPSSSYADCEYADECQLQASLRGLSSITCTPASLDYAYEYAGPPSEQGEFDGMMVRLIPDLEAAIDAFHQYSAQFLGEMEGDFEYVPSPLQEHQLTLEQVLDESSEGPLLQSLSEVERSCVRTQITAGVSLIREIEQEAVVTQRTMETLATAARNGFDETALEPY